MSDAKKPSRRDFLKGTTAAAAGMALAGGLNFARTAHAAGSDELKIALIGCGGRGTGAVNGLPVVLRERQADRRGRRLRRQRQGEPGKPEERGRACREDRRAGRPHLRRLRRLREGDRRRPRRRAVDHAARFPADPLRRRRQGRQARLHGEALLRRRPGLPLADGNQQAGRRKGSEGRRRPATPPQQGVSRQDQADSGRLRSAI